MIELRAFKDGELLHGRAAVEAALGEAKVDRGLGIETKLGQRVFENDHLILKLDDDVRASGFMRSNAGQHMTERGFDALVVFVRSTSKLSVDGFTAFVKDGKLVRALDETEYVDPEDEEHARRIDAAKSEAATKVYGMSGADHNFIAYVCGRGAVVVGNAHVAAGEVCELVAKFERDNNCVVDI